jgi:hypothetical protein
LLAVAEVVELALTTNTAAAAVALADIDPIFRARFRVEIVPLNLVLWLRILYTQ